MKRLDSRLTDCVIIAKSALFCHSERACDRRISSVIKTARSFADAQDDIVTQSVSHSGMTVDLKMIRSFVKVFIVYSLALICAVCGAVYADEFSSYRVIVEKNIFRPLWAVSRGRSEDKSRKEELEALRKADDERKETLRIADEQNAINAKKIEIEEGYSLTGIVFEQGRKQAIIQSKNGVANFLFEGDAFEDIKIISINESKGEVTGDYLGKFTVKFGMK